MIPVLLFAAMSSNRTERLRLMIVAGEPSGDAHAAALVEALRDAAGDRGIECFGATGVQMREAGVESVVRADELSILGLVEIAGALKKFWSAFRILKRAAIERQPDAVILVDWPDFNLRLARALHRKGLHVIYYISPQLWAWRSHRVHSIRRDVDLILSILPFESEWYQRRGVEHVKFVGHPLVSEVSPRYDREEFCRRNELDPARPIVALLPGSRHKEIVRILPQMLDAVRIIAHSRPDAQFVIALAANRPLTEATLHVDAAVAKDPAMTGKLHVIQHETREILSASDVAAVASGTATLEAALIHTPFVIVYRESFINWHTLGRLIKAEHFGLINLIAGKRLVVELMQNDLTGERLADELVSLLVPENNRTAREQLREAAAKLGEGGASGRAARAILEAVDDWKSS